MVRIDICTGTVYLRAFRRFTVSCNLNYEWYPFDEQVIAAHKISNVDQKKFYSVITASHNFVDLQHHVLAAWL